MQRVRRLKFLQASDDRMLLFGACSGAVEECQSPATYRQWPKSFSGRCLCVPDDVAATLGQITERTSKLFMKHERRYWFKAKASGLGWSTPLTWQGWLVYISMFCVIAYFFFTAENVGQKLLGVWIPILVCLPLFVIFGEPLSRGDSSRR